MNEVKYENTDRSGEVVVRSTKQSMGIKEGGFWPRHHLYMMGNYSEP